MVKQVIKFIVFCWAVGGIWFVSYMNGFVQGAATAKGIEMDMPFSMMGMDLITWPYQLLKVWLRLH